MTYLIVGVDRSTLASWHQNVTAEDACSAALTAAARAAQRGIDLVVAAVIGPASNVLYAPPVEAHVAPQAA
jgi:predicted Fe-Mo cluster-binding NifX family protein